MFRRSLPKVAALLAVVIAFVSLLPLPMNAQGSRYSLTFHNTSGYTIYRIYMSSSDDPNWMDQLGADVLVTGDKFKVTDIPAGEYDLRFVDADGDMCELSKIQIFRSLSWNLTQDWLLDCEFGRARAGRGASRGALASGTRR